MNPVASAAARSMCYNIRTNGMSQFFNNAIFWVEVDKIHPNPFQPRREFDESRLQDLADSIKMYGVLQPLIVTRKEVVRDDGSLFTEYELISGERRLRASRLAGLVQVPVLIRSAEEGDKEKLELAIIENLQREDLNPVDRARAFRRLVDEFSFKHVEVARRIGKSREYVSNSLRILDLPEEVIAALVQGKISEGHTRPILMLVDRPAEQMTLFRDIMLRRITVRDAEGIARRIAFDRVRKKDPSLDPEILELEEKLRDLLGARVQIERRSVGGKLMIDFVSNDELRRILDLIAANRQAAGAAGGTRFVSPVGEAVLEGGGDSPDSSVPPDAEREDGGDEGLYIVKNFTI